MRLGKKKGPLAVEQVYGPEKGDLLTHHSSTIYNFLFGAGLRRLGERRGERPSEAR